MPETSDTLLSNAWYDRLKKIVQVVLPALATLYLTLSAQWDLPNPEAVAASITAIATFLGVFLIKTNNTFINSDERFTGAMKYKTEGGKLVYSLELEGDPAELVHEDEIVFKVQAENPN
jgi:hypothetical protein